MAALASSVESVWALSIVLQLALFALLFAKRNFRALPILTIYMGLNLCQAGFEIYLYVSGNRNWGSLSWAAEGLTLVFQALAALEAMRLILKPYPGIWALGWRAIAFISAILLAYIAKHMVGHYDWALLEATRGYHLVFSTAVISCFLLMRYYAILVPAAYKLLLGGFCFFSCASILSDTVLQSILYPRFAAYETMWQLASMLPFVLAVAMWLAALYEPLPADERPRAWPSDEIYRRMSPIIDERLRHLDERLMRIWKTEARS